MPYLLGIISSHRKTEQEQLCETDRCSANLLSHEPSLRLGPHRLERVPLAASTAWILAVLQLSRAGITTATAALHCLEITSKYSSRDRKTKNQIEMPKERNYNPVQAQRKADKAKAIKKGTFDPALANHPGTRLV